MFHLSWLRAGRACPNCGTENTSFFGTILSISSDGSTNNVQCSVCGTEMIYHLWLKYTFDHITRRRQSLNLTSQGFILIKPVLTSMENSRF
ncbi:hypothetical protein N665_0202s0030 [Sinapis alba]|nr:hypothetical protein N665_0202s0030 [Sinapis alba]